MRLISKVCLGFALALSFGAALSACGDDSGPLDLYYPIDHAATPHDLSMPTDGGGGDLAQ